jgi:hypothetical protein
MGAFIDPIGASLLGALNPDFGIAIVTVCPAIIESITIGVEPVAGGFAGEGNLDSARQIVPAIGENLGAILPFAGVIGFVLAPRGVGHGGVVDPAKLAFSFAVRQTDPKTP